ncbi:cysteine-rich venom protein 1 [Venturia canescens]|uniref:cysteine-rich venom protein 1 n=1 Tax=Venturia canescens TaxID=32260 RepID=UPI001C9CF256|nr:cysteine-rich venom protein 1 [Venturia canescens]
MIAQVIRAIDSQRKLFPESYSIDSQNTYKYCNKSFDENSSTESSVPSSNMTRISVSIFIIFMVYTMLYTGEAKSVCGPNAELRVCGELCEPTCERPAEIYCLPIDPNACKRECRCLKGYVRNKKTGSCIKREACPKC